MDHKKKLLKEIICRDCGIEMYSIYSSYTKPSKEELIEASEKALATFKPVFGACVMMSATLVAALDIYYSIPAIAVLGDLKIDNNTVFKCNGNIPMPQSDDDFVFGSWDGHCWVMAGDILIDLSLFRTAYRMNTSHILPRYINESFGNNKGALLSPIESIPEGMVFLPKYALNGTQISMILNGASLMK